MTPFEWIPVKTKPEVDADVLVWMYDKDCEIGYVWPETLRWNEGWHKALDDSKFSSHKDMKITYWCYVTKEKNSRTP